MPPFLRKIDFLTGERNADIERAEGAILLIFPAAPEHRHLAARGGGGGGGARAGGTVVARELPAGAFRGLEDGRRPALLVHHQARRRLPAGTPGRRREEEEEQQRRPELRFARRRLHRA